MTPIVTLTTDFGDRDYYVGALKGALLSVRCDLRIVDITHSIARHDVVEAAFVLRNAATEFPLGALHLAIVDPGVGSSRHAIAVASGQYIWVGPDNGLLSFALDQDGAEVRKIANPDLYSSCISATFHGRDVFAPCVAHLADGFPFYRVGPAIADAQRLTEMRPTICTHSVSGQIVHIDHFGNAVTNICADDIASLASASVKVGGHRVPVGHTYSEVGSGQAVAVIGSNGLLEVAINGKNGADQLHLNRSDAVMVESGS